jgi:hypothetical protein
MTSREALIAQMEKQRAAQGLPPRIEDVAVLSRIATIMRLADRRVAGQASATKQRRKR